SERRIERLVNPDMIDGLPAFLARRPGMESGFMIAHVAAAALLNEAKVLAHPSSVDSVPTSGGKEDHVAMGMTGALKLRTIVDLAENLTAIELLAGAEALEHRRPPAIQSPSNFLQDRQSCGVSTRRSFPSQRGLLFHPTWVHCRRWMDARGLLLR